MVPASNTPDLDTDLDSLDLASDPDRPTSSLDPDEVAQFSLTVWTYRMGESVSLMIHLGDLLGLYRAMAGQGAMTSSDLATATGLDERLVREWLHGQAAARLIDHDDGHFVLTPVQAAVLAEERSSPAFAGGAFRGGIEPEVIDAVAESFRTGIGITYEQQGPRAAAGLARMTGQSSRLALVPIVLPALAGVVDKLTAGATVVDVGCGGGTALTEIATAFPKSRCVGYDPSTSALDLARSRITDRGLSNIEFVAGGADDVSADLDADLIMTLDVLHDLPHPDRAAAAIRSALADDGTWLIKEIRSTGDFERDRRNPLLPLFYGFSVFSCLQSAVSEPDGMGLGTLGLHPERLNALVAEAGFDGCRMHDLDDPGNLYYEVTVNA